MVSPAFPGTNSPPLWPSCLTSAGCGAGLHLVTSFPGCAPGQRPPPPPALLPSQIQGPGPAEQRAEPKQSMNPCLRTAPPFAYLCWSPRRGQVRRVSLEVCGKVAVQEGSGGDQVRETVLSRGTWQWLLCLRVPVIGNGVSGGKT